MQQRRWGFGERSWPALVVCAALGLLFALAGWLEQ